MQGIGGPSFDLLRSSPAFRGCGENGLSRSSQFVESFRAEQKTIGPTMFLLPHRGLTPISTTLGVQDLPWEARRRGRAQESGASPRFCQGSRQVSGSAVHGRAEARLDRSPRAPPIGARIAHLSCDRRQREATLAWLPDLKWSRSAEHLRGAAETSDGAGCRRYGVVFAPHPVDTEPLRFSRRSTSRRAPGDS